MEINGSSALQPYITQTRADLTRASIEKSAATSALESAQSANTQTASTQTTAAPVYGHASQEITNATEVAVMEAQTGDDEQVPKSELDKAAYQASIESAEQALMDAALLVNEARQRNALIDIFQETLTQSSESNEDDNELQDNYLDGVQRFTEAETKLIFAEARDAVNEQSPTNPTQVRSILI